MILLYLSELNISLNLSSAKLPMCNFEYLALKNIPAGATKPDPIIFNAALEQTGSIPENTIHIGDQILSDIQGALNSGIKPILIDRDRNHIGYTEHPRIESLSELHRFIGDI